MSFIGRLSDSVRARFSETDSKSVPMLGFTEDEHAKEISLGTAIVVDESSVNVAVALSLPEDTTHLRRKEDTCFALSQIPHSEVQRVHSRNAPSQWRPSSSARSPPGPPSQGLDSYGLLLTKLLGAGFDMKCRDDYTKSVLPVLQECGGSVQAIASSIDTNVSGGLPGPESFAARKAAYGHNRIPQKPMETFWQLCLNAFQDPILRVLSAAAIVSIILGCVIQCAANGWYDGFAVLLAISICIFVSAGSDFSKARLFRALSAVVEDRKILAYRYNSEQPIEISVYDVMVGDVLYLRVGDKVPADCFYLSGANLSCNEADMTGESVDVCKGHTAFKESGILKASPFLFSGTLVVQGTATALVLAVGTHTILGKTSMLMQEAAQESSPLQEKLGHLVGRNAKFGLYSALITLAILLIRFAISFGQQDAGYTAWSHAQHWKEIMQFIINVISVLVVAIPEGLPLAVNICYVFSVRKMISDNNLVRNLNSCETMGAATTICSDKTGTLTTNNMTVMRALVCDVDYGTSKNAMDKLSRATTLPAHVLQSIFAGIIFNCDNATSLYDEKGQLAPKGNKTELALLKWAEDMNGNYRNVRAANADFIRDKIEFPFSSQRKRMSAMVNSASGWTLYTKGASEIVLGLCSHLMDASGAKMELSASKRSSIESTIKDYAEDGLRTMCIACRAVPEAHSLMGSDIPPDSVEQNLIMLAIVGIEDPVRPEVPHSIELCRKAGIVVRMVTGDNLSTAVCIARKCGILERGDSQFIAMEGPEFRSRVMNADGTLNQSQLDEIWPRLRVLARSSPIDKHTLVSGIMASKASAVEQVVAVTGDGTNDAPALKKAHIGFAMGISGTEVAKQACDIIVLDDNFKSVVAAVRWGRGVYDNICKIVQFNLTVCLSAITIVIIGTIVLKISPLSSTQLLWINLLNNSLAALAMSTENPSENVLNRQPHGRSKPLMTRSMLRNILGHAIYQVSVIFFFVWGLPQVTGIPCGRPNCLPPQVNDCQMFDQACYCAQPANFSVQYTMIFNVFVFMTLMNVINMRNLGNQRNVFRGIFNNAAFWLAVGAACGAQALLVQFGGAAFNTTPISPLQWAICLIFALGSLLWHQVVLSLPLNAFSSKMVAFGSPPSTVRLQDEEL